MTETRVPREATLDRDGDKMPPVGTLLVYKRGDREQSFVWDRNHWAGRSLHRSYLMCGWTLVSARPSGGCDAVDR